MVPLRQQYLDYGRFLHACKGYRGIRSYQRMTFHLELLVDLEHSYVSYVLVDENGGNKKI